MATRKQGQKGKKPTKAAPKARGRAGTDSKRAQQKLRAKKKAARVRGARLKALADRLFWQLLDMGEPDAIARAWAMAREYLAEEDRQLASPLAAPEDAGPQPRSASCPDPLSVN